MSETSTNKKKKNIVILGGGFGGVGVLKDLQKKFQDNEDIQITLISNNNFLLFTPMLPEIVSGTIESRHIVTSIRSFCKNAKFYEAQVKEIDMDQKQVTMTHIIGKHNVESAKTHDHTINYDRLVIALGSEDNFFGNSNIEKYGFTLKTIGDAILLRNHIIKVLEQAVIEQSDPNLRKALMTFVVVGGGFSGVETVGAINDFVRESVQKYYPSLYMSDVRVVLVSATDKILEQIDEGLGRFALEKLKESGVEFIMNTKVKDVTTDSALLDNDKPIPCYSVVWTAGVAPSQLISNLKCEHDKKHRIITNSYLEVNGFENIVYALGDCASIINPHTGKPYPATAQHAIRQSEVVSYNIASYLKKEMEGKRKNDNKIRKKEFNYKTKGMMAEIGKRTGVAILFGKIKLHGFSAWWLWRSYYWLRLPTSKKKLKVMGDWTFDLIFKPDVSQIQ
ncbi:MAG: NAD(P)/FAD-dependent oxidoreductase [Candidatus Nitrosocosmicus sp.]|nr:NAD(P)/FAD-dependent oxidoreductase [Candidatus Nitrosocosmicus sp.]MDN5866571.1 NAD(P)/FAD-dependent oxidoreductase [Candidatus Nitrosocosmicus sp.]